MAQLGLYPQSTAKSVRPKQRSKYAVEVRHVKKSYAQKDVYTDLHFQLNHGTFVAATGPIGCGKSTLINMFAGLEKPTSGSIIIEGTDITLLEGDALAAFRAKNIGLVPQVQNLLPELTVRENIGLPLAFAGLAKLTRDSRPQSPSASAKSQDLQR
jgi:putative ABC transport system ATP-binding protein